MSYLWGIDSTIPSLESCGRPACGSRILDFGRDFNHPIVGVGWPASLQQLVFGRFFNQPIAGVLWRSVCKKYR